jgi:hypothetical protein
VSRRTRVHYPASQHPFTYGTLTPSGRPFQAGSVKVLVCDSPGGTAVRPNAAAQPPIHIGRQATEWIGFRLLPFRSPLLWECSLFLRVLRCFSSPTCPLPPYRFRRGSTGMTRSGLPHSEIDGSPGARPLPVAFRSPATSFLGPRRLGIHRVPVPLDPHLPCHPPHTPVQATRCGTHPAGLAPSKETATTLRGTLIFFRDTDAPPPHSLRHAHARPRSQEGMLDNPSLPYSPGNVPSSQKLVRTGEHRCSQPLTSCRVLYL